MKERCPLSVFERAFELCRSIFDTMAIGFPLFRCLPDCLSRNSRRRVEFEICRRADLQSNRPEVVVL
jgi:hypothetical protein